MKEKKEDEPGGVGETKSGCDSRPRSAHCRERGFLLSIPHSFFVLVLFYSVPFFETGKRVSEFSNSAALLR